MTYKEVLAKAKENMAPNCRVCRECDGAACRGEIPGTGGKGSGSSFTRNFKALSNVKINMDLIYEDKGQDTSAEFFGHKFAAPVFAAPISGLGSNYNGFLNEKSYAEMLVSGCLKAGCAAFTGDGAPDNFLTDSLLAVKASRGMAVPTVKPWDTETLRAKLDLVKNSGAMAVAMDIDSAGLPLLAAAGKPVCSKGPGELRKTAEYAGCPFIVKGIMTPLAALKAARSGAYGIVVSNHGGRVLDHTPATIEVLPEIKNAVGDKVKIFIDGGFRTGADVFKALALGADAVLVGRPYVIAACGGGEEGVKLYTEKIISELQDTMKMTGCAKISDINESRVRVLF
ncbi:MAG TPA: alpha-hydroxy-acid oxidizing enzyme [Ruminococcaceae bacterium]|nr:alpha-hydroxy-acid oxidizing enzyme [Oscillospiraceae bacterium]